MRRVGWHIKGVPGDVWAEHPIVIGKVGVPWEPITDIRSVSRSSSSPAAIEKAGTILGTRPESFKIKAVRPGFHAQQCASWIQLVDFFQFYWTSGIWSIHGCSWPTIIYPGTPLIAMNMWGLSLRLHQPRYWMRTHLFGYSRLVSPWAGRQYKFIEWWLPIF